MNFAGKQAKDGIYTVQSAREIVRCVRSVKESYKGIHGELVEDMMTNMDQAVKSKLFPYSAMNGEIDDENFVALLDPNLDVEERNKILRRHVGLKNSYTTFLIAIASEKEATARNKMLTTLHNIPITCVFDIEDYYLFNTRYMFWFGVVGSCCSGAWVLATETAAIKSFLVKIFS